jgi:hypothetical protein
MTDDSIVKNVLKNLGEIGEESGKETVKQAGKITEGVITGWELYGVKPMREDELAKKKVEDEKKKQEELAKLRQQRNEPGRNVEEEIKRIREEKERVKEQEEKNFEQMHQQQNAEEAHPQVVDVPGNPKKEAAKVMFAPGKKKKQKPTADQMSQTSEFKGGKID